MTDHTWEEWAVWLLCAVLWGMAVCWVMQACEVLL